VAACLKEKGEAEWAEFVRRFHPLISTVVFRTARSWGEISASQIDDLVQETFLKLCLNDCRLLRNFRPEHSGAIFGFLKVVTANVVHDHFKASRAAKRGGVFMTASPSIADCEQKKESGTVSSSKIPSVDRSILFNEIDRCLIKGVAPGELTRSRRIFWLYYRWGFSASAIASLPNMNLSTKGVESTLVRLNRLVRTAFEQTRARESRLVGDPGLREKGLRRAGSL
jgi:RNA polymerase sigma-70 factor (ECF subfamily)